jgi:hypothetical protein
MGHRHATSSTVSAARVRLAAWVALVTVAVAPAIAEAAGGTAMLAGRSALAVKGCGRDRGRFAATLALADDGTWVAAFEGATASGTYTAVGRTGRTLELHFDAPSSANLGDTVAEDVSLLCEAPAAVTSTTRKVFRLTINRRRTRAALVLRYRFAGTAAGVAGTATYKLTGRGPWIEE